MYDRVIMDWSVITVRASLNSNSHLLGLAWISIDSSLYAVYSEICSVLLGEARYTGFCSILEHI